MRRLLTPLWLGKHVLAVVLVIACVLLGRWQLGRGLSATGGLQNLGYAGQWWFFGGVVVYGWFRMARDEVSGREPGPSRAEQMRARVDAAFEREAGWVEMSWPSARPATPATATSTPAVAEPEDLELAAYNDYLARLHGEA